MLLLVFLTVKMVLSIVSRLTPPSEEDCILLGHYAACSGSFLPKLTGQIIGLIFKNFFFIFLTPDYRSDRLSRNVGNKVPLLAA
jgi:hypothetical protein